MNRKRAKQVVIRMSDDEYALMKEKVKESGLNQQTYLITAITQKEIINTEGLKVLYPELSKQGSNLNQIAKKLNEGNRIEYSTFRADIKEMSDTWQLLKQFLRKLK